MREFLKFACAIIVFAAVVGGIIAWSGRPNELMSRLRIILPSCGVVALGVLLYLQFQRDRAPDLLFKYFGRYFDRSGFCFKLRFVADHGVCVLVIPFQNRHERPCSAQIAIRSAPGFFGGRPFDGVKFDIEAGPAAFGIARVPIPMPVACQGKRHRFDVAATAKYPQGKGRMLRFRDGLKVKSEAGVSELGSAVLTIGLAAFGHIHISGRPASITLSVPAGVSEALPSDAVPVVKTFWTLGDMKIAEPLPRAAMSGEI